MKGNTPKEMKAVQVVEYNKPYKINTIPVPDVQNLGPFDLLVKVAVASYCHTDSMIQSGTFATTLPLTASHEGAGTVVAAGPSSEIKPGDRVMCGLPYHPCGECPHCTGPDESQRQYCVNVEGHCGVHRDGFFAEYALCDARSTTKLSDEVSFLSAAPLACAGRTVWRGVEQAGLKEGEWLAIVGSGGGLGHLGVQFAKKKGLKVIGIDARDEGLQLSKGMGADVVVDARKGKEDVVKQVQDATHGANPGNPGVDATVTLSDASSAAAVACAVTKMHGTMVQVAQPNEVVIPFMELIFRDIRVKGSVVSSPEESKAMVRFIAENGVKVKTNVFEGLDKLDDLLEMIHSGKIQGKAVIVIDPEQIEFEKQLGAKY
ncbi:Alcohol dehydrogenase [Cytospora mali]|uniref:Alcohol dehydrogenase n=1 Tax=Cytospora mali TaxID=578113 RepID=A0A194WAD2_CYTMA|nr:Alcohol dehydrogenase [Valsa mali]